MHNFFSLPLVFVILAAAKVRVHNRRRRTYIASTLTRPLSPSPQLIRAAPLCNPTDTILPDDQYKTVDQRLDVALSTMVACNAPIEEVAQLTDQLQLMRMANDRMLQALADNKPTDSREAAELLVQHLSDMISDAVQSDETDIASKMDLLIGTTTAMSAMHDALCTITMVGTLPADVAEILRKLKGALKSILAFIEDLLTNCTEATSVAEVLGQVKGGMLQTTVELAAVVRVPVEQVAGQLVGAVATSGAPVAQALVRRR